MTSDEQLERWVKPTDFPESNFTWKGWPATENRPEVLDLPAYRSDNETISCWELSEHEIAEVARTGRVWLRVVGQQPPVCVEGGSPFVGAPGDDDCA